MKINIKLISLIILPFLLFSCKTVKLQNDTNNILNDSSGSIYSSNFHFYESYTFKHNVISDTLVMLILQKEVKRNLLSKQLIKTFVDTYKYEKQVIDQVFADDSLSLNKDNLVLDKYTLSKIINYVNIDNEVCLKMEITPIKFQNDSIIKNKIECQVGGPIYFYNINLLSLQNESIWTDVKDYDNFNYWNFPLVNLTRKYEPTKRTNYIVAVYPYGYWIFFLSKEFLYYHESIYLIYNALLENVSIKSLISYYKLNKIDVDINNPIDLYPFLEIVLYSDYQASDIKFIKQKGSLLYYSFYSKTNSINYMACFDYKKLNFKEIIELKKND